MLYSFDSCTDASDCDINKFGDGRLACGRRSREKQQCVCGTRLHNRCRKALMDDLVFPEVQATSVKCPKCNLTVGHDSFVQLALSVVWG